MAPPKKPKHALNATIRVVAADDHPLILDGIKANLKGVSGISLIGIATNGKDLLSLIAKEKPDVALVDISMPVENVINLPETSMKEKNGISLVQEIKILSPLTKVIIQSLHGSWKYITAALEQGVNGYIVKNSASGELVDAIRKVAEGGTYFSPDVTDTIMKGFDRTAPKSGSPDLTKRQKEVLKHICNGLKNPQIAEKLFLETSTIDTHRKNIMATAGVNNAAALVKWAFENGLC